MPKLDYGQRPVSAHCRLRRIGGALVAVCTLASILVAPVMAQAGQVPPEVEPNEADRATARRFGQRIATATLRWAKGA